MVGSKSGVEVAKVKETADQQAGANQQDKGDRDLRDDQEPAKPRTFAPARCVAAAFLERCIEAEVGRLSGRREAEDKASNQRDQSGEDENFGVDPYRFGL